MIQSKIQYSELHCFCFNYRLSTDCVHTLPEIFTRVMILEELKGDYTIYRGLICWDCGFELLELSQPQETNKYILQ